MILPVEQSGAIFKPYNTLGHGVIGHPDDIAVVTTWQDGRFGGHLFVCEVARQRVEVYVPPRSPYYETARLCVCVCVCGRACV